MSSARIRVLQVMQHAALGGTTLMAMLLARGLDPERYDVALAASPQVSSEGNLFDEIEAHGRRLYTIPDLVRAPHPLKDLRATRQLRDLFREFQPHIVDTHNAKPKLLVPWAVAGAPVPVTVAHISSWEWLPARNSLERALFVAGARLRVGEYDAMIAISEAIRQQGIKERVGRPEQYAVIHSFADVKAFVPPTPEQRAASRVAVGLPPEAFVMVSVGRLAEQKAPADLVAAAALVIAQLPHAHLLVVGDGHLRPQVSADIAARGLQDNIHLLGARRDIPQLMHAADLFVLSSHWEALGMVYLEAGASGLASVGTAVDGAIEAVLDGETGLMVEPKRPERLAEAVLKLANDTPLRERMGRAGVAHAQRFSEEQYLTKVEALYQKLLKAKGIID